MIKSYLQILQDSLVRKLELLKQIEKKSLEQAEMLKTRDIDLNEIDLNMDAKTAMIDQVLLLDDGFESLYERVRTELISHKDQFKNEIAGLQKLITQVTEKSASIQAIEARNKAEIDIYFSQQKKGLQSKRNAMSVARDYYQNMNKVKHVSPQFLDQKK